MSWAILHIPSGEIYTNEEWEYMNISRIHMEYYIHAICFDMIPVNTQARLFRMWCESNKIKPLRHQHGLMTRCEPLPSENEFEILENYEVKDVTGKG